MATRDSGSGQVQSTKLDRTWVLLILFELALSLVSYRTATPY